MKGPTDEEIAQKLVNDPRYFIERVFSIVDQSSQEVPFLFNPLQSDYYANRTQRDIILKPRKAGFSAVIGAILLHACLTRPHTRAVVISHEEDATKRLFRRIHYYLTSAQIKFKPSKDSERELLFPDAKSSFYIGTAGSRSFGRGDDLTHIHLSESAHYADERMLTGVQEALIKGAPTWLVEETTARGAGTPFHQRWLRAIKGESAFKPHFYGWHQDPMNRIRGAQPLALTDSERTLKEALSLDWEQITWRRAKLEEMLDPSMFPQEYPATWEEAFLASGAMLFDWAALKRLEENRLPIKWKGNIVDAGEKIDIVADAKGPLEIYRTPTDQTKYLIVADAAQGVPGSAFSVADIYDIRTWDQVAQWRGHCDPEDFGKVITRMGAFYGWAVAAVENNYPGNATLAHLSRSGYPNLYDDPAESGDELGFKTTEKSKSVYISDGRSAVKDGSLKINSLHTINEMRTFVLQNNGRPGPQPGCFQDTVVVSCKAANLLKSMYYEPEIVGRKARDILGMPRRRRAGPSGGVYRTGVV